jgi:transcription antitermination factor NusG
VPTCQGGKCKQGRHKPAGQKLFPGYVFCRFAYEAGGVRAGGAVVTTPGIIRILGGVRPIPIASEEIEAIQLALAARLRPEPWPFQTGEKVKIESGPLRGISGVVLRCESGHRLVLSVELLHRSVAAVVESDWISPVVAISRALDQSRTVVAFPRSPESSKAYDPPLGQCG